MKSLKIACLALAAMAASTLILPYLGTAGTEAGAKLSGSDGVVGVRSAYTHAETIDRLKKDVEAKGITFFMAIDQSKLASDAGIELKPSTLLVFGNPALGSLFITANPVAGLDWPVRVLVHTDADGQVWAAYSDFEWIARRHQITTNLEPFKKATSVIASITGAITSRDTAPR